LASGQRAVIIIGPGCVCSKDANGCSGRGSRKPVIAAKRVGRRPGGGDDGRRARCIAPPRRDANAARNKRGGIGNDRVSTSQQRQLAKKRRARASAQRQRRKILRPGGVLDRVVMSFLPCPTSIQASVFAASRADWLCVAFSIAKRAIRRGVGTGVVSA
jgi:hypothetical protein